MFSRRALLAAVVVIAAGLASTVTAAIIDISTGVAGWRVLPPNAVNSVSATALSGGQVNGTWAPAPSGSSWVSWGAVQGMSCVGAQTPGIACASVLTNAGGDTYVYTLIINAASLGATSGTLNFLLGADNRVSLAVGAGGITQVVNGGSNTNGAGFNPLYCSNASGPTNGGNTAAEYSNCVTTLSFNAASLNGDGSLTLTATIHNDPVSGCAACGDPTGFILRGSVSTGSANPSNGVDISTGVAGWQVLRPGAVNIVASTALTGGQVNSTWAPAPTGSSWISWGSIQGTTCTGGQTPGVNCASALVNANGDSYTYTLVISAAALGATSGNVTFVLGADNRVSLMAGVSGVTQVVDGGSSTSGTGYNPLGCSNYPTPISAGNTQSQYASCVTSVPFSAANLNGDGSLTLAATVHNDPVAGCPACGDPTGFVLKGSINTRATLLDVDRSSPQTKYDSLTDGLLVLRYLFGLTGTSLSNGVVGATATRSDPAAIKTYLDGIRNLLDIDNDGRSDALSDGLLVVRYLFGLRGATLISGAVGANATRTTSTQIETYLQSMMP